MALKQLIEKLGHQKAEPALTLSMQTHRTHPDNTKDPVLLKNLVKEAEQKLLEKYPRSEVAALLDKLEAISDKIDPNYNLDSLHIFLSGDTEEIVRLPMEAAENAVYLGESFSMRPLIKALSRTQDYLILVLSQNEVKLYEAMNDSITQEIKNEDFPFPENPFFVESAVRQSDAKHVDRVLQEFLNLLDKAVLKVHQENNLDVIVISTRRNFDHLMEVADKKAIYIGNDAKDYSNMAPHQVAQQAWEVMQQVQFEKRSEAINELKEAISSGQVLTDLGEIYRAAMDGRGDLLIKNIDYVQPVKMVDDRKFDLVADEETGADVREDITSDIAWEVFSKKGRVVYTRQDELAELGKIALKTRY